MNSELWIKIYAPKNLKETAGNEDAKEEIRKWALETERKKIKPLLIYGPPGIGKTATAYALASEMNWNILETNASDLRDAETLQKIYGIASQSNTLFNEKQLILIDEVDAVSDRQEFSELQKIFRQSLHPIILIANDVWNPKLTALRAECRVVEFKRVNYYALKKILESIAEKENGNKEICEMIAKSANGDLRGAINDLQSMISFEKISKTIGMRVYSREREENVFNAVKIIFKTSKFQHALDAADIANVELNLLLKWVEENIPIEYEEIKEQAEAFRWISKSDVFQGRIIKRQNYSFLKYARVLGLAGVSFSKTEMYKKFTRYIFPTLLKKLSQTKKNRDLMKSIWKKISKESHISVSDARYFLPFITLEKNYGEYFKFSDEEISFLSEFYEDEEKKHKK